MSVRPDRPLKPWGADPAVRAFTEQTEIPDSFPAASEFRRAGYTTYLAIFRMSLEELAALEDKIGPDVIKAILALREAPGGHLHARPDQRIPGEQGREAAAGTPSGGRTGAGREFGS